MGGIGVAVVLPINVRKLYEQTVEGMAWQGCEGCSAGWLRPLLAMPSFSLLSHLLPHPGAKEGSMGSLKLRNTQGFAVNKTEHT